MKYLSATVFLCFLIYPSLSITNSCANSSDPKKYVRNMLFTSAVGTSCEVVFTALSHYIQKKDKRFKGHTYLWMIPVYASIYPIYRLVYPKVKKFNALIRYLIYVSMIYGIEYTSGKLLQKLIGHAPWEKYYRGKKYAVDNLIRLDYIPIWCTAAIIFEKTCHACDNL